MLLGELGFLPWEYARMTFKEVLLAIQGLRERDEMFEEWIRRATLIIGSSNFNGKEVASKFERMWPGRKAPVNKTEAAKEQLRKFRENAALKRANQKLNGRA